MRISNSMAKSYLACRKQYTYKFEELIVPKTEGLPLYRGNWLHELLEARYKAMLKGEDPTKAWRKRHAELTKEFMQLFEEERELYGDQPTICKNIMKSYDYTWAKEEKDWDVIFVEEEFEIELPHGHIFVFKIDGLIEDDWGKWLMEHKSHKTIPDSNYRFIDIQTARYFWGLEKIGYELAGVLWNYMRTKAPSRPAQLKNGGISRARKYDTDLFTFLDCLKEYGLDPGDYRDVISRLRKYNDFLQRERVPKPRQISRTLVKDLVHIADEIEKGVKPIRTIDRNCTFMCSYLEPCMTELYGGDARQIIASRYRKSSKKDYYATPVKESQ